jgi:hypothetical protein
VTSQKRYVPSRKGTSVRGDAATSTGSLCQRHPTVSERATCWKIGF